MANGEQAMVCLQQMEDMVESDGERGSADEIGAAGSVVDTGSIAQGAWNISGIVSTEQGRLAGLEGPGNLPMGSQEGGVGAVWNVGNSPQARSEDRGTAHSPFYDARGLAGERRT